ncbi:MAG: cytochrome o ubiquinol oxidase subunit IV [Proteobacteria bacterium]|nr:cytochrome o ubiquinol oxidase subunit IV [Pseudomonadota bacterium]
MTPVHLRRPHVSDYINGFLLAIILTVVPFGVVAFTDVERGPALLLIAGLAVVQVAVHLRYFLHYSTKRVPLEATIALGLAVFMSAVLIGGAIWIMTDLHHRMMP